MRIDDLTIIMPVHERQWTLARALPYLQTFEGPVIVADSSREAYPDAGKYPWIDYRHTPGMLYYPKMRATFETVQTKFLVDVPDDDFTLLTGLKACCDYMRANPDVSGCGGHILRFVTDPDVELTLDHTGCHVGTHILAAETLGNRETIPARYERLFDNVVALTHAVLRKDAALMPYTLLDQDPELQPVRIFGQLVMFGAAALGRIAHLNVVLMLRGLDRLWSTAHFPKQMQKQITVEQIAERVPADGGVLTRYLMTHAGIDEPTAMAIVTRFVARLKQGYPTSQFERGRPLTLKYLQTATAAQQADIARALDLIRGCPGPKPAP